MGQSSQAGQVMFRTQAVAGTYQADTGTAGIGMKLRSGTLTPNRDLLIPDPEIGGTRDITDAYLGAIAWAGDYEFYGRINGFLTLLQAALGPATIATAGGITTATVSPTDGDIGWLSVEETVGTSLETFHYWDTKVNTLHLEADANGYLMGTAGLIACKQSAGNTKNPTPLWDNTPMYVGTNITISYNGVTLPAKSFSLDINNNIEDDDFRLGSLYLGGLVAKRREMTMGCTIRPQDSSYWRQAVYGASSATVPGGIPNHSQTIITISSYEFISGSTPYSITITVPSSIIQPFDLAPSGDDVIQNDLTIQAVRPNPATPIATFVGKTGTATIA